MTALQYFWHGARVTHFVSSLLLRRYSCWISTSPHSYSQQRISLRLTIYPLSSDLQGVSLRTIHHITDKQPFLQQNFHRSYRSQSYPSVSGHSLRLVNRNLTDNIHQRRQCHFYSKWTLSGRWRSGKWHLISTLALCYQSKALNHAFQGFLHLFNHRVDDGDLCVSWSCTLDQWHLMKFDRMVPSTSTAATTSSLSKHDHMAAVIAAVLSSIILLVLTAASVFIWWYCKCHNTVHQGTFNFDDERQHIPSMPTFLMTGNIEPCWPH